MQFGQADACEGGSGRRLALGDVLSRLLLRDGLTLQSLILISIKALLILRSLISGLSTALPVEVSLLIRMSRLQFPCALRLMHPGNM